MVGLVITTIHSHTNAWLHSNYYLRGFIICARNRWCVPKWMIFRCSSLFFFSFCFLQISSVPKSNPSDVISKSPIGAWVRGRTKQNRTSIIEYFSLSLYNEAKLVNCLSAGVYLSTDGFMHDSIKCFILSFLKRRTENLLSLFSFQMLFCDGCADRWWNSMEINI